MPANLSLAASSSEIIPVPAPSSSARPFLRGFMKEASKNASVPKVSPSFFLYEIYFFVDGVESLAVLKYYILHFASKHKNERLLQSNNLVMYKRILNYSSAGASTGQASAHAPHSMHSSALISYLPSTSTIALTGQASTQEPQAMQASEILYAMIKYLHMI
jgi:hypothetical protein